MQGKDLTSILSTVKICGIVCLISFPTFLVWGLYLCLEDLPRIRRLAASSSGFSHLGVTLNRGPEELILGPWGPWDHDILVTTLMVCCRWCQESNPLLPIYEVLFQGPTRSFFFFSHSIFSLCVYSPMTLPNSPQDLKPAV